MDTFIDKCLSGDAQPDQIDEYVHVWHQGQTGVSLREFMGLSDDQYSQWLLDDQVLEGIIDKRRASVPQ